jgi:MFS family permease
MDGCFRSAPVHPLHGYSERELHMNQKGRFLLGVLSLTGFVTSFGAYVVAANLPSYSKQTGAGLIVIGFLIALYDIAEIFIKPLGALLSKKIGEWAFLMVGMAGIGSLICLGFLRETRKSTAVETV